MFLFINVNKLFFKDYLKMGWVLGKEKLVLAYGAY